jgi:hypothetical protein
MERNADWIRDSDDPCQRDSDVCGLTVAIRSGRQPTVSTIITTTFAGRETPKNLFLSRDFASMRIARVGDIRYILRRDLIQTCCSGLEPEVTCPESK